jgi:nitroreductase
VQNNTNEKGSMATSIADVIKNRRTIHQFKANETPPLSLIKEAIEHAVWAPNHHLSQPWHFHLLGSECIEQICQLNTTLIREQKGEKVADIKLKRWREVPGWLVLSCDISEDALRTEEDYAACCCVAQNLSLYLWENGVGMKWTTGTVTRNAHFYELLGLEPGKCKIVGLFWYGYPADIPKAARKPIAECINTLP